MFLESQIEYLLWLQNLREATNSFFDPFFLAVTHFGEFLICTAFLTLIYWSVSKKAGEFLILISTFSILCNQFLKMMVCINRPWLLSEKVKPIVQAIPQATGYSFPSGHTANAMAVWGGLAIILWNNKKIRYTLFVLIALIAFSRNYLGVHTPQDVIVSFVLGIVILYFANKIFNKSDNDKIDLKIFAIGFLLALIALIAVIFKYFSLKGQNLIGYVYQMPSFYFNIGYIFGILLGWFACKKLVPFETYGIGLIKRVFRFIFGYIIVLLILFQWIEILISDFGKCKGNFICAFVIGVFITFFYPWLFTRIEKFVENKVKK